MLVVYHCIHFLMLLNNLVVYSNTHRLSHSSEGQRSRCTEPKGSANLGFSPRLWGKDPQTGSLKLWQKAIPCGSRNEVPGTCWLSVESSSASRGFTHFLGLWTLLQRQWWYIKSSYALGEPLTSPSAFRDTWDDLRPTQMIQGPLLISSQLINNLPESTKSLLPHQVTHPWA